MSIFRCLLISIVFTLMSSSVSATEANGLKLELEELIQLFSSAAKIEQMKSVKLKIQFSGIDDPRLFDIAEKNMLSLYVDPLNREDEQYASWMAKMLAFSGREKYISSLQRVISETKSLTIQRHANAALEMLPSFQRWNPVISQGLDTIPRSRLWKMRVFNMLKADDPELVQGGASVVIHYYIGDTEITDFAEQRLIALNELTRSIRSDAASFKNSAKAASWLCRVLGTTKNKKYLSTLEKVKKSASSDAVVRWSGEAIGMITGKDNSAYRTDGAY